MATGFSNYLAGKVIDHILRNQAFTPPTTVYVALFTAAPTRSTAGTEVTAANGYARVALTLAAAASGASSNSGSLSWTASGGSFGTVVAVAIMDASTAGNVLWYGDLTASRTIPDGTTFTIASGALTLDGAA